MSKPLAKKTKIPKLLYKYRSFSNQALDMLVADQIFFSDPSTFNDPLDARPSVQTDLGADALESILKTLIEQRINAEMSAAAKTIKYQGPKTLDHITTRSRDMANKAVANIRYNATNPEYKIEDPAQLLFGMQVEEELLRRYDKGIFSLAERANCPLMWSHYADQHKGLCIGYSVPSRTKQNLHKIAYGGSRLIQASTVQAMLNGDKAAQQKVDQAVLSRKAIDWRYEKEWRLINPRGLWDSPLELEEVVFGMRCSLAVKFAVTKALVDRQHRVRFYEIRERRGSFLLGKYSLDLKEMVSSLPRRSLDVYDAFGPA